MILLSLTLPIGALSLSAANSQDKIDATLKEKMATASPDEKIPVAIWYEDVDQNKIDTLTAKEVGFSEEEIDVDYEMPSTELLTSLKAEEAGAVDEMQAYLQRTERQREKERKRTDEYIMTRREFSREKYNEKSAKVMSGICISDDNVEYRSKYSPLIMAYCTSSEITAIAENNNVETIYYNNLSEDEPTQTSVSMPTEDEVESAKSSIGYDHLNLMLSDVVNGEVKIGMFENGGNVRDISMFYNIPQFIPIGDTSSASHVENTVKVLLSFAPNAIIYSANKNKLSDVESLLDYNVTIINASCTMPETDNDYGLYDKWADHIVSQHNVSIVASAGNYQENRVLSPAMGHNVITVGQYNQYINKTTLYDISDDTMLVGNSYLNYNGVEKPDVVMPGNLASGGTSSSAPVLTASIALLFNMKPSLSMYPQAVKAIVLASCHRKVLPATANEAVETMEQGITEKQGAGAPDVWAMACIISQGTYGVGRIQGARTQATRRFVVSDTISTDMNVSITWLRDNSFSENANHGTTTGINEGDEVNLDLKVYRDGVQVGASALEKSSTEMAYFSMNSQVSNYEIRINEAEAYSGTVRYGYAYCTNNPYISPVTEEGIYYIRNYYSDKYLTLDTETNEAVMENFTGNDNQKWIIRGSDDDYEIYPAYGTVAGKLNFGTQVGTNPYYKAVLGTEDLNLEMKSWETDTTLEPDAFVFTSTSGGSNNILSYTYSNGIFVRSETDPVINSYRMWVLEDINFRRGDANMDGKLTPSDATLIQRYLALHEGVELNNQQLFLADANRDGQVTLNDVTHIGKILSDLIIF